MVERCLNCGRWKGKNHTCPEKVIPWNAGTKIDMLKYPKWGFTGRKQTHEAIRKRTETRKERGWYKSKENIPKHKETTKKKISKSLKRAYREGRKKYPTKEVIEKLIEFNRQRGPDWRKTADYRKKMSEAKKGKPNGLLGFKHSKETINKFKETRKGERNPNWKGGITKFQSQVRSLQEYKDWRNEVFKKDKWICKDCGKKGGKLHAHHIKKFSKILEENNIETLNEARGCKELWDINNGITLCKRCHKKGKHK